jgi:hypothetical protein
MTPYRIRREKDILLDCSFQVEGCENSGQMWDFKTLRQMNVSQDEVLGWNSSIEMGDQCAGYLRKRYLHRVH